MPQFFRTSTSLLSLFLAFATMDGMTSGQVISQSQLKFFETNIRPVLVRECYSCHSNQAGKSKGGLQLDSKVHLELGGNNGPAVVAGNVNESLLWQAINHEAFEMPPGKKLTERELSDFRSWIEMGAPDPRKSEVESIQSTVSDDDVNDGRKFWSFTKPKSPKIPEIANANWPRNSIDNFIAAKLELESLTPVNDADPNSLLRRLCTDLTGLPPNPEQIASFVKQWHIDPDAAINAAVDRLLSSDQFGERWGRHWLDVARFAESTGREVNATIPNAWRYRDYVIDSFNNDKPYDKFIQEQIAGDLLPARSDEQWAEQLVATGFLALGPKSLTEVNARQFNLDVVDEQIDVTTRVILGVSVACARCHDHKFDPIQQKDYYAMAGIFESTSNHYGTLKTPQNRRPSNQLILPVADPNPFDESLSSEQIERLNSELANSKKSLDDLVRARREARRSKTTGNAAIENAAALNRATNRIALLESKLDNVDESGAPRSFCVGVQDKDQPHNARLLVRGEFDQPDEVVRRGFVQVLYKKQPRIKANASGRLELAKWLTDAKNPLTARVMVNRIWLHLFGTGIVRTPEDFGSTGLPPTHPDLLDYLAIEFMADGWSVKNTINRIVSSRTYRMSTTFDTQNYELDSDNLFYWRANSKQLDAESLRDAMLFASGVIDTDRPRASIVAMAGMTVVRDGKIVSFQPASMGAMRVSQNRRQTGSSRRRSVKIYDIDEQQDFRSVYLPIVRDNLPRALEVFDFAEPGLVVGQRETSNTPSQGLFLLNNQFVMDHSKAMASRLMKAEGNTTDRIKSAFLIAYGRPATEQEIESATTFYRNFVVQPTARNRKASKRREMVELQKLTALTHAIFASAEFRYTN